MKKDKHTKPKKFRTVGRNVAVDFVGHADKVPAKVDTGADSSSVWATDIMVDTNGLLRFKLFGEGSPFYTGQEITSDVYTVAVVRSASGHEQIRYRVTMSLRVKRRRVRAVLNLSDRSKNKFPVLIGRRTLKGKFVVDVTQSKFTDQKKVFEEDSRKLNTEMQQNQHAFYKKYFGKDLDDQL